MPGISIFQDVPLVPTDHVFAVNQRYNDDTHPKKVNLGIGAYRNDDGKPMVLPVVAKTEKQLAGSIEDGILNHEYLPIDGLESFTDAACKLALGPDSPAIVESRVCGAQAISGTGSLRLGMQFLRKFYASEVVYVSKPTWGNHKKMLLATGYKAENIKEYRYFDNGTNSLDFDGLCADLESAPEHSIILLHACAHNPTGVDPSQEQWKKIAEIMKGRSLFPLIDMAYQGFVTGDPDEDAWAARYFVSQGFEVFIAQSFAKNFGLYNERCGNLCAVTTDADTAHRIRSQLKAIIRPMWSNPPNHGARIVATILNSAPLQTEWRDILKKMAGRILKCRKLLFNKLRELGTPGTWEHIVNQKGMFGYTGLSVKQVDFLEKTYHIYMLNSGRVNICGITESNVEYIANAIHEAVTTVV
ncbi:aspartate aminotransferase, cytoplasmic-like [Acropora millepora]|uniref:aspartate aminotransferase, cytoplasmic-like n=1 Tax=Acropora millepora TaxID=45264 RepID=UPI001CF4A3C1|nr:aspartate aminotransferase, cytoplasmic-like [Acropora millepora]